MSLLEAFYYTFAADATPLEKALNEAEKKADQLKNTVSGVDENAQLLGTSFVSLAKKAAGFLGIAVTLGGLKTLAVTTAETTSALGKQAQIMGVNVTTLDAWRKAVTESGGNADAFTRTLGKLSQRFRDPEQALLRLSKTIGGMSAFRAQRRGKMLGLDESTFELLRQGRVKVEELIKKQKEQGAITKEQVEQADRLNLKLRQMKGEFENLKTQIGTALIPVFEKLLDGWNAVADWVKDNQEAIMHFFIALAGIVTAYYLPAMIKAGIATLAATWPVLLAVAAFAALALVIADVIGYFTGMDSALGDLVKDFPILGDILEALKGIVLDCWNALVLLVTDPMQFLKLLKDEFVAFLDLLFGEGAGQTVLDWIGQGVEGLKDLWGGLNTLISKVISAALAGFQRIGNAWKKVKGWFGAGKDEVDAAEKKANAAPQPQLQGWETTPDPTFGGGAYIAAAGQNPVNSMTSNSITNSNRTESRKMEFNVDKIEVVTQSSDPEGMASGAADALQDAYYQFGNGLAG